MADPDDPFAALRASIADSFTRDFGTCGALVRLELDGTTVEERVFAGDAAAAFADWIVDHKTEAQTACLWPRDGREGMVPAQHRYPPGVRAFYLARRAEEAQRIAALDVAALPAGWSLSMSGRGGALYYRDGERVLELGVEMSAVRRIDLIVYADGLRRWLNGARAPLTAAELRIVATSLQDWLRREQITTDFSADDFIAATDGPRNG